MGGDLVFPHFKKKKRRKKSAPKAPWGGAAGAGRRRRRRRGSAGGAGNNDAVIKTSLWPRVHVFAELGRVRLAHRERARLRVSQLDSSCSYESGPALGCWVACEGATGGFRRPRRRRLRRGKPLGTDEETQKFSRATALRAARDGRALALRSRRWRPAGAWLEMGRRRRAARSRPPSAGSRLLARPVLGGGADWQAHWWARWPVQA